VNKKMKIGVSMILCIIIMSTILIGTAMADSRHTVKRGDTLWLISRRYGTTVNAIKQRNGYWTNMIYPGQVFTIPSGTPTTLTATTARAQQSSGDIDLLAKAINAEARGESLEGQVAVGAVILNRVKHKNFPNTLKGVIYQPGAFCVVRDGQINLQASSSAKKAAELAVKGWDPTNGAIYFFNPAKTTNKWMWSRPVTAKIGSHWFAK
jgi:N-acetylmuramoyl-L-alanine amidase